MARPEFTCTVQVRHLEDESEPPDGPFAFAYTIRIANTGDIAAQVVARHWRITDARGIVQEVRGLAVVGRQPLLQPGETFEYTSGVQIATPQGSMAGTYFCMTEDAHAFEAPIPEFRLGAGSALH